MEFSVSITLKSTSQLLIETCDKFNRKEEKKGSKFNKTYKFEGIKY